MIRIQKRNLGILLMCLSVLCLSLCLTIVRQATVTMNLPYDYKFNPWKYIGYLERFCVICVFITGLFLVLFSIEDENTKDESSKNQINKKSNKCNK